LLIFGDNMAIKNPIEEPIGAKVKGICGLTGMIGFNRIGKFATGSENNAAGIYRIKPGRRSNTNVKMNFYTQWKERTVNQIAAATTFKNGMTAWSALTEEEKEGYNERAIKYKIEGVNLFIREWMRSH